jgi:competence protein ComEC
MNTGNKTMPNGKFSGYLSAHPFIFLASLAILASVLVGGALRLSNQGRNTPVQSMTATASATPVPRATSTNTAVAPTETATLAPTASTAPLVVTFIDVGQGDSTLIESPDGQVGLIDGGSSGSGALTYLQNRGIKSIDIMIASTPADDHIGGLSDVLDAMPVRKVVTNAQNGTTPAYRHFLDAVANAKVEYEEVTRGDDINLGKLTLSVLNPDVIKKGNLKTNSLVLGMSYKGTAFLFMGEADSMAEAEMLAKVHLVRVDILKLGQHGSCAASSPAFLDVVHPTVAVYFAKAKNPYGYPCAATIHALDGRNIFVYGTDMFGSMIVTVNADGFAVTSASGTLFRR